MNFDLSPHQIAAADQVQAGISDIVDKIDELTPLVMEEHGDRQRSLMVIAVSLKTALSQNLAPEFIIAEMALRQYERSLNG